MSSHSEDPALMFCVIKCPLVCLHDVLLPLVELMMLAVGKNAGVGVVAPGDIT